MDRDEHTRPRSETGERLDHQPRIADALKSGAAVSIMTWGGRRLQGTVSDKDQSGLLLGIEGEADGAGGYAFVPWSSVEQVDIPEVAQRRVKFLQS